MEFFISYSFILRFSNALQFDKNRTISCSQLEKVLLVFHLARRTFSWCVVKGWLKMRRFSLNWRIARRLQTSNSQLFFPSYNTKYTVAKSQNPLQTVVNSEDQHNHNVQKALIHHCCSKLQLTNSAQYVHYVVVNLLVLLEWVVNYKSWFFVWNYNLFAYKHLNISCSVLIQCNDLGFLLSAASPI